VDQAFEGIEQGSVETWVDAPHFVIVGQLDDDPAQVVLTGSHDLTPYGDPDDGLSIQVGGTLIACLDYPADADYLQIELETEQKIEITVRSVAVDPLVAIAYPGLERDEIVGDDDSGGGVTGLEAQFTYEAPHEGTYWIIVADALQQNTGGYILTVEATD
jgi:hypothetical protein